MPTYMVTNVNLELSDAQKSGIAAHITQTHSAATNAPGYFAQVIFRNVSIGDHFIGGKPNKTPHLYTLGLIRAGRTEEQKTRLMVEIARGLVEIGGVGAEDVWVYVQDLMPKQMIEFGRVLPEPGGEAAWQLAFSAEKLSDLRAAGVAI